MIDEVRHGDDGWVVVEIKTTDRAAAGEAATTQVLAYALAIELIGGGTVSRCEVLGPRGPRTVPFDDDARRRVSELLDLARATDGSDTAPGVSTCNGCPVRDSCPAYQEWTENQWREGRPAAEDDVWGVVAHVDRTDRGGTLAVNLTRPDGARVLVRGVPSSRPSITAGAEVAAFGLQATGTRRLHGAPAAPTSFHELPTGVATGLPPAWGASWEHGAPQGSPET